MTWATSKIAGSAMRLNTLQGRSNNRERTRASPGEDAVAGGKLNLRLTFAAVIVGMGGLVGS